MTKEYSWFFYNCKIMIPWSIFSYEHTIYYVIKVQIYV